MRRVIELCKIELGVRHVKNTGYRVVNMFTFRVSVFLLYSTQTENLLIRNLQTTRV